MMKSRVYPMWAAFLHQPFGSGASLTLERARLSVNDFFFGSLQPVDTKAKINILTLSYIGGNSKRNLQRN